MIGRQMVGMRKGPVNEAPPVEPEAASSGEMGDMPVVQCPQCGCEFVPEEMAGEGEAPAGEVPEAPAY